MNSALVTIVYKGLPFLLGTIWIIFGVGCYVAENHLTGFHLTFWAFFFALQVATGVLVGVLLQRLYVAANTDGLTQLWNRKYFYRQADSNPDAPSQRNECLILLDLDNFKQVNDARGHQTGDDVLRTLAEVLRNNTRPSDTVARLGGDEFAILLPDSGAESATAVAERIREAAQDRLREFGVTVSIGIASFNESIGVDKAVAVADKALYQAKDKKNSVVTGFA